MARTRADKTCVKVPKKYKDCSYVFVSNRAWKNCGYGYSKCELIFEKNENLDIRKIRVKCKISGEVYDIHKKYVMLI